jgi:transposase
MGQEQAKANGRGRILGDAGRKDANPGSQERQLARSLQAFELAAVGRSMRSIAAELGVSVGTVHSDIERVRADLRTQTTEFAARQRDIDLELIAELIQRWAPFALAEELNISKEVQTKRGVRHINLVTYEAGCMATDRLLKLIERRAKMLGYDAPTKVEDTPMRPPPTAEELKEARESLARWVNFAPRVQGAECE